ncbi:hypothetical protein ACTWJ8_31825 [Streptomyces sp. SDT5-1]|uniref:hypothetical protein n=1 Tax=Streptomyces sp. SDT5-1 TaxID=3406418 RepID=UPI003FD217CC
MKVRMRRRVFVGGQALLMVSGVLQVLVNPHSPVWRLAVTAVAGACLVAAIVLGLRDFRRQERRDEVGE